jgi:hypothetical protein
MKEIKEFVDFNRSRIGDARITQGEAIILALKPETEPNIVLSWIIDDLRKFALKTNGWLYYPHRDPYSSSYRLYEPGKESYGYKVYIEGDKIIIKPIALIEDLTFLKRYFEHLKAD